MISQAKLTRLLQDNTLKVEPFLPEHIKGPSLKLHLGVWYQMPQLKAIDIDMLHSTPSPIKIEANELHILPNQMVLAKTLERIQVPEGYMGWLESRARAANVGLQVHLGDAHLDPGTDGTVWLQLKNQSDHTLILRHGTYIAKLYLFQLHD